MSGIVKVHAVLGEELQPMDRLAVNERGEVKRAELGECIVGWVPHAETIERLPALEPGWTYMGFDPVAVLPTKGVIE